jgi:hypothetical protein
MRWSAARVRENRGARVIVCVPYEQKNRKGKEGGGA